MNPLIALKAAKIALPVVGNVAKGASSALSALSEATSTKDVAKEAARTKTKKTADDFETMFLEQMVDRMVTSQDTEGPLGSNGTGGDVWRSMLGKEYAKQIQKSGGVGISAQVMDAMIKMQGGQVSPASASVKGGNA
jgi:peptidoglycan hydrolase FlgJ